MHKVDQTLFGNGDNGSRPGNCLQACLASIFNLSLDEVPHFVEHGASWYDDMQAWLMQRGYYALDLLFDDGYIPNVDIRGYHCLNGISPRGIRHSVVCKDGDMIHDPHPSRGGIVTPTSYRLFVALLCDTIEENPT